MLKINVLMIMIKKLLLKKKMFLNKKGLGYTSIHFFLPPVSILFSSLPETAQVLILIFQLRF